MRVASYFVMQPKRKKGTAAAQAEADEDESTLIYEEQPAASRSDGGSGFYYDEGDDYAEYEATANAPTIVPAITPAPAAPMQVTEEMRLRIEANKRAAEARRAAKAAAAAAELVGDVADGREESTSSQQGQIPMQQDQRRHMEEQDFVVRSSASVESLQQESQSQPELEEVQQQRRFEESTFSEGQEQPCLLSGEEQALAADATEAEQMVAVNGQGEEQQEGDEGARATCEEGDEGSVFTMPLRSIIIGCSDSVFASLTKRIVSFCCYRCYRCCCCPLK